MNTTLKYFARIIMVGTTVFTLAGCAGQSLPEPSTTVPAPVPTKEAPFFLEPQRDADKLPAVVPVSDLDIDTSRFLGTDTEGYRFFAAHTFSAATTCLIVVTPDGQWARGCSDTLPVGTGIGSTLALLHDEPIEVIGGGQIVGKYVHVTGK